MNFIEGGLAAGKKVGEFDPRALAKGTQVEMEHTNDPAVAQEIAADHLTEDPLYYEKLELMEEGALDDLVVPLGAYGRNPGANSIWGLLALAGAGASVYHGYKRNEARNPVAWALWWGLWGAVIPIITVPIAVAQGFAKPAR